MNDQPVEQTETTVEQPKYVFDFNTVQPVQHNWIDRGLKLSCENAGHAHHEVWKRQKAQPIEQ